MTTATRLLPDHMHRPTHAGIPRHTAERKVDPFRVARARAGDRKREAEAREAKARQRLEALREEQDHARREAAEKLADAERLRDLATRGLDAERAEAEAALEAADAAQKEHRRTLDAGVAAKIETLQAARRGSADLGPDALDDEELIELQREIGAHLDATSDIDDRVRLAMHRVTELEAMIVPRHEQALADSERAEHDARKAEARAQSLAEPIARAESDYRIATQMLEAATIVEGNASTALRDAHARYFGRDPKSATREQLVEIAGDYADTDLGREWIEKTHAAGTWLNGARDSWNLTRPATRDELLAFVLPDPSDVELGFVDRALREGWSKDRAAREAMRDRTLQATIDERREQLIPEHARRAVEPAPA